MSQVRICDRCHEPIPGAVTYGWVQFGEATPAGDAPKKDLCLACLADLRGWMDPSTCLANLRAWMDPSTCHAEVPR